MTVAELAKKYGVHPTQIGSWKRAAIENMTAAFSKRGGDPGRAGDTQIDKLHSVDRQVIACQSTRGVDWYSRKVLSWRLSNSMDDEFCVEALKEAVAKYGKPEIMNNPSRALLRNTLPGNGSRQPIYRF